VTRDASAESDRHAAGHLIPVSKPSGGPDLRRDLYLQNDSGAYSLLSSTAIPRVVADDRANDFAFVRAHEVILQSLVGDDEFVVRIVEGEALSAEEEDQWISRVRAPLKIPCGRLLVCGGFDPDTIADLQEDEASFVEVPPGDYVIEVLTYLNTMNGRVLRERAWGEEGLVGRWFRRECPGRPFPAWVASELVRYPREDPGHETEWSALADSVRSGRLSVDLSSTSFVGVVVHLLPANSELELTEPGPDGFFPDDAGLRRPERFPFGITTEIDDHQTRPPLRPILT
jgi:hypothetical protein